MKTVLTLALIGIVLFAASELAQAVLPILTTALHLG